MDLHRAAIGRDIDAAVEIGAKHVRPRSRECLERRRARVAVLVVHAGRDQRDSRMRGRNKGGSRARLRPVMADLEDVGCGQPALQEQLLDRQLSVAGEERRESAATHPDDDRTIVDVALEQWRYGIGGGRIQHLDERCGVERDDVAGAWLDGGR